MSTFTSTIEGSIKEALLNSGNGYKFVDFARISEEIIEAMWDTFDNEMLYILQNIEDYKIEE